MAIFSDRQGYCERVPLSDTRPVMGRKEFLEKTIKAVKARKGLIHGKFKDHGRVCVLGAFASKFGEAVFNSEERPFMDELQELNDSMPRSKPERRRKVVLAWLEDQLGKLA
jgi:hypothetical protein